MDNMDVSQASGNVQSTEAAPVQSLAVQAAGFSVIFCLFTAFVVLAPHTLPPLKRS